MRVLFISFFLASFAIAVANCPHARAESVKKKIVLFNGKNLDNFYTFLRSTGKKDPKKVFSVQNGMIRVSGEEYGFFITEKEYENYHLQVEFKWGEATFKPREGRARDSGILLHCVGKDKVWMTSIECQMIEGGTGDFILVGGGKDRPSLKVRAEKQKTGWYYNPKAEAKLFKGGRINWWGRSPVWKDKVGFRGKQDAEKQLGEWNTLECICAGGKITNILNFKVVNQGTEASLRKGKILFQSEGAELFFRKIELHPLQ